jgi:hypothetical protein
LPAAAIGAEARWSAIAMACYQTTPPFAPDRGDASVGRMAA